MCLDLYVHWVSRSMHLTELKQSDWVISAWIINEFEKIFQTLETVYQTKQLEVGQKYSELSSYFQLSSRCRKTCSNKVFRIWNITSQLWNYRFPKSYPPGLCQRCEPKKRLIFSQTEISWFLYIYLFIYLFILYIFFYQRMILDKQLAIPEKCARQS